MRRTRGRPRHPDVLTPAEWAVALLVGEGLTNEQIAARRRTSLEAVRYHLGNIRDKLLLPDRRSLASWVARRGDDEFESEDRRIRMGSTTTTSTSRLTGQATMLLVRDVARTAEWFRDGLGFRIGEYLREHHHGDGDGGLGEPVFVIIERDGERLMLSKDTSADRSGVRSNRDAKEISGDVYFWVTGIEASHEEARARGLEILEALHEQPYGMREFVVRTPDGHVLTFGE